MFEIEKGVEMPGSKGSTKYPFGDMEVGDSFLIDKDQRQTVTNAAWAFGRRNGKRFSVRKFEGGFRCWRVE